MNYIHILYELNTHLQKHLCKHSSQSLTSTSKHTRQPELTAYLLVCFSRQQKWLHFSLGNLIATSHIHTISGHGWCLDTAQGPQEVNKLQESMVAFSHLTKFLQLHRSARLSMIYGTLYPEICYFREINRFPALGTATRFFSDFFYRAALVHAHRQYEYKNDGGYVNNGWVNIQKRSHKSNFDKDVLNAAPDIHYIVIVLSK